MKKLLYCILFLFTAMGCTADFQESEHKVLLISFDGFRTDYLTKTDTPNFDKLVNSGVISEGLIPVFPTKTFPNHYAIATGLYPENNGLIANNMYDPEMDLRYAISDREQVENPDWYDGEPIWNTVEKSGKKAGAMFWVGSEAPIQGMRPTFWKTYDGRMDRQARIDTVVKWMSPGNENEIDLGTLYFSMTDNAGHRYGPDSEEVVEAIQMADSLLGYLIVQLEANELIDETNIIIVSDHGMSALSRERIVVLDDYIDPQKIEIIEGSPSLMFNVTDGDKEIIYQQLKAGEEYYSVYKRETLPERYRLKGSHRVPDIVMVADIGYTINTRSYFEGRPDYPSGGTHGFDNQEKEMHAIFVAHGPDLKSGLVVPPFENVHLFVLMTELLDIDSPGTNGDYNAIKPLLK